MSCIRGVSVAKGKRLSDVVNYIFYDVVHGEPVEKWFFLLPIFFRRFY